MKQNLLRMMALLAGAVTAACTSKGESPKSSAPAAAKVDNRVKESDLTQITLTQEAAKRLGIELVAAVDSEIAAQIALAGEVLPASGKTIQVNAPVAGSLAALRSSLVPGQTVRKGEPIFRLTPLAGVQRDLRVTVDADVKATKARLDTAAHQLERSRQLLRDLAGSQRNVEAAEQEFAQASAAFDAAVARVRQVNTRPLETDVQMTVTAPDNGIVRQVQAVAGQAVSAGTPLFEVVDLSRVWLRVPVYAGHADALSSQREVTVQSVDGTGPIRKATRVLAPPTADPLAVTADLYFELPNPRGQLRPGQRLTVRIPSRTRIGKSLMVPAAAILYDVQGGAWVYVNESGYVYRRQRVELLETQGSSAYLARGINAGTKVVTSGAAELFGTEFGAGK